jgi:hypothetical protein
LFLAPHERFSALRPTQQLPHVWAVFVEERLPGGATWTAVASADNTMSLYLSSGGGYIGGGTKPPIRLAGAKLLIMSERLLPHLPATGSEDVALPGPGEVGLVFTFNGPHAARRQKDLLLAGGDPLVALYGAAQGMITAFRLDEEARKPPPA